MRPGCLWNTIDNSVSCFIILFMSSVEERCEWHPDRDGILLTVSKLLRIGRSLPMHRLMRCTDLSVILDPRPLREALHSRLRCSICRSHGMFLPFFPCVLIVRLHVNWETILGLRIYLSIASKSKASIA